MQSRDEVPFTFEDFVARSIAGNSLCKSLLVSVYLSLYHPKKDLALCGIRDVPPSAPIGASAVVSDAPTLILTGEVVHVLSPAGGRDVAANLSQPTFVEFPGDCHALLSPDLCAASVKATFLEPQELDTACEGEVAAPQC